jgi:hypothetical protein
MRKLLLLSLLSVYAATAHALVDTSIHENFNGGCATVSGFPSYWVYYSPPTFVHDPRGDWTCAPTGGRSGTPGISCTGQYDSMDNLDTAYLISPLLNLSSYSPGHIYLDFDTKTTILHLGGKLAVLAIRSDTTVGAGSIMTDLSPVFGIPDSSDWVTHHADLTHLEDSGDFYIAFRYTSTTTTGSIWYLDNINTTIYDISLGVSGQQQEILPMKVIGASTPDHITLSYTSPIAATCQLSLYDMLGRKVYGDVIDVRQGEATYTISNANLHPGMYCAKMGNGMTYGIARVIVQ